MSHFQYPNRKYSGIFEEDEGHLLIATWGNGVIKLFFDPLSQDFTESFTFSTNNGCPIILLRTFFATAKETIGLPPTAEVYHSSGRKHGFLQLSTIGFQDNKARACTKMEMPFT